LEKTLESSSFQARVFLNYKIMPLLSSPLAFVFIAAVIYALGDASAKFYGISGKWWFYILTIISYAVGAHFFLNALKTETLSRAMSIVPLVTMLIALLVGYFYFHERLSALQYVGAALAIMAITLLAVPWK
jgi:multidrug transporter EmrE-like cation transporter